MKKRILRKTLSRKLGSESSLSPLVPSSGSHGVRLAPYASSVSGMALGRPFSPLFCGSFLQHSSETMTSYSEFYVPPPPPPYSPTRTFTSKAGTADWEVFSPSVAPVLPYPSPSALRCTHCVGIHGLPSHQCET